MAFPFRVRHAPQEVADSWLGPSRAQSILSDYLAAVSQAIVDGQLPQICHGQPAKQVGRALEHEQTLRITSAQTEVGLPRAKENAGQPGSLKP